MDLAIDRGQLARAVVHQRSVVGSTAVRTDLVKRARMHPDSELPRGLGEELRELAVDRLGLRGAIPRAEVIDVLGKNRKIRTSRGRPVQKTAGHREVVVPVIASVQLTQCDAHEIESTA